MAELKFKGWMASNKVRQKELAVLLGLSGYSVYKKVNGKEDFTLNQIRLICSTYNISADIFLPSTLNKFNEKGE